MSRSHTTLRWLLLLAAFVVIASSCGGDGDEPASATTTRTARRATPTRTATVTATASPTATATPSPPPAQAAQPTAVRPPAPPPVTPGPRLPVAGEIRVPPGFAAYNVSSGYYRPTSVTVAGDGSVFVSERHGNVFRLADRNGDGAYEEKTAMASGIGGDITGVAVSPGGTLYVSRTGRVSVLQGGGIRDIISGLPNGRHQNNGMAFGPDGALYVTNGSTCDECVEADPRSATILVANQNGGGLRVYASGLRNPYDIAFDGQGRLWSTDNGSDAPCTTSDELNLIRAGGHYGWPYGPACNNFASGIPPVVDLGRHTASTGITAYLAGQFPARYRGDLFLTLWGSDAYTPQLAPALVYVATDGGGGASASSFGSGFQHPIDVTVDRDGTLLVLDYGSGNLYRIAWVGS